MPRRSITISPVIAPGDSPVLLCDVHGAERAAPLARALALETKRLDALDAGGLAQEPQLVVVMNLLERSSVLDFRRAVGAAPPTARRWIFVVPKGQALHAAEVQANALGATDHVTETAAVTELRRLLSIAGQAPMARDKAERLRREAGGASILAAGDALGGLFASLHTRGPLAMADIGDVGAAVIDGIQSVGAESWLSTVRAYHEGTFQHCLLVTGAAAAFAERHGLHGAARARLTTAALLHDIGKSVVPLHILDKPGRLSEAEFAIVRAHPRAGHAYLAGQRGIDPQVLDAVLHHHEALDGSGYPDGLAGDAIPMLTRILTVCDIYAALVEARAYKPPRAPEEAISMLVQMALNGKVDYGAVRSLAQAFGMDPPRSLEQVKANLAAGAPMQADDSGMREVAQ